MEQTEEEEKVAPLTEEQVRTAGIIEIGSDNAPLTLLLFTEHHCRYCKDFMDEHFPQLQTLYIDPGFLKLQIAVLPLKKYLGSHAAATILLCAAHQGKGLPMHQLLHTRKHSFEHEAALYAVELELDEEAFEQCLASEEAATHIEEQASLAESLDVSLVPTLFLDGEKKVGLPYWPDMKGWIEQALRR